jgi:toxin ParE1/3/4
VLAIVLTPAAQADLVDIWAYIAADSSSQADRLLALIDSKFQSLSRQPGLGKDRDELSPGLRSFPVGSYVIFYIQDSGSLLIVRVLHGARDVELQFREEGQP